MLNWKKGGQGAQRQEAQPEASAAAATPDITAGSSPEIAASAAGGAAEDNAAEDNAKAFFLRPEPLAAETHGALGVKLGGADFSFARRAPSIPVTLGEFASCASCYPIIFIGEARNPHVVMGARQGHNVLVRDDGAPDPNLYAPAFLRRYPFVFGADHANKRMVLCVDRSSDRVVENGGEPLFVNGEPSPFTNGVLGFMKNMERQRQATAKWVRKLIDLDLFETKEIKAAPRGNEKEAVVVARYEAISLDKLHKLPEAEFAALRADNALVAVYAHIVSLQNWRRILNHAAMTAAQDAEAAD